MLCLRFFGIFNFKTDDSKGRVAMLISAVCDTLIAQLTGGLFYTGFLIGNDIDIVNLGIIQFLPLIASCFSIFAPLILERFPKRRNLLAIVRLLYFAVNLLGLTLLPIFVTDKAAKAVGFGVIVFVGNLINALTAQGYSVWHLNFIPDEVRAEYFSFQQITSTTIGSVILISSSLIADSLRNTPYEMTVITVLRYIAFGIALFQIIILLLPKEYEYPHAIKIKFRNVFTLPFSNKKFMLSMLFIAMWQFASSLNSLWSYYLLNDVKVPYTFVNGIDAAYAVFLICLSPFAVKLLKKLSWMKTFGITALLQLPTNMLYSFTNASNFVWIMLTVRLTQHILGVAMNLSFANFPFLVLPKEDRSNYLVFYTLVVNITAFVSSSMATGFVALTNGLSFPFFGASFCNVQVLLLICCFLQTATAVFVLRKRKIIESDAA